MFRKKIKKVVTIEGMMCEHCASKVEKSLLKIENVDKVKVNLKEKTATISSLKEINDELIISAINALDYKVINIAK